MFQTYKQCQVGEHWFDTPQALGSNLTGGNFFHRAFVTQKCQHYQLCVLRAVYVCPRGMLMCDINLWLRENLIIPCKSTQGHKGSEQIIPSWVHVSTGTYIGTAKSHQGDLSLFDISNCKQCNYEKIWKQAAPCLSQPIIALSVRLIAFPQSRQLGAEEPRNLSLTGMSAENHSDKELG